MAVSLVGELAKRVEVAALEQSQKHQMWVKSFKKFCYGWNIERNFYSVAETFAAVDGCANAIVVFAMIIALYNLWRRNRARPNTDSTVPEMAHTVSVDKHNSVTVQRPV